MNRMTESNQLLFEALIEDIKREYQASGIAVAVVDKNGKTQYEKFFGCRDMDHQLPVDGDTIFGLASVTKSFTCLAIMQLVEKGILNIDDPVSQYVPEFTNKNQKETVRIKHLMSHSGGFFPLPRITVDPVAKTLGLDETVDGDFAYNDALASEGVRLVAERLDAQTEPTGLIGNPGEYFSYCNDGYGLLSDIIRRYGGEASFADYLKKHILNPLNMRRSGCDFVWPKQDDNAAILYQPDDQGGIKGSRDYHDNAFVLNGGGAMKSTLNDMKKYLAMYLNEGCGTNGERIISEHAIHEMTKPCQLYGIDGYYGYGLSIKQIDDLRVIEHGGSLPGVSSNISFSFDAEAAVIVLCNTSEVPVQLIADAAMRMYNGKNPLNRRDTYQETPWTTEIVDMACGTYVSGEGTTLELYKKENGQIGVINNGKKLHVIPIYPRAAMIRAKMSDGFMRLHITEEKGLFALTYGSRMFPKIK